MTLTVSRKVHFQNSHHSKKTIRRGEKPKPKARTQRISNLMAMAICFNEMIKDGGVKDMAEIAVAGQVTRARMTQIMNLNLLAPDIQEAVLALPKTKSNRDVISIINMQSITLLADWKAQREKWNAVMASHLNE